MGKYPSEYQKVEFLTYLNYTTISKAAKLAGLEYSIVKSFRERVGRLEVEHIEKGLPPLMWEEKVARKPGSRTEPELIDKNVNLIFKECTLNRKQRKKCQFGRDLGTEYSSICQLADIYRIKIKRWGRAPLSYRKKQIQAIPN